MQHHGAEEDLSIQPKPHGRMHPRYINHRAAGKGMGCSRQGGTDVTHKALDLIMLSRDVHIEGLPQRIGPLGHKSHLNVPKCEHKVAVGQHLRRSSSRSKQAIHFQI